MTRRARYLIAVLIMALAYVGSYFAMVERGWPGSKIADPDDTIYCPPDYRNVGIEEDIVAGFFIPIHKFDAIVRYDYWNPIVQHLAEEANRSGNFKRIEE